MNRILKEKLILRGISVSLDNVLDNSKAASGGERDVSFLKYLVDSKLLVCSEAILKRTSTAINQDYYNERYKKMHTESDRHYICRVAIQEELFKLGIETLHGMDMGNMNILRSSSNYDIITVDLSTIIDIGLTPARNYFRGLTDINVKSYLITTYFDDYMDDIIFYVFSRSNDDNYLNALKDYEDCYKMYVHGTEPSFNEYTTDKV